MTLIQGIHLVKRYGNGEASVLAVREATFAIDRGEFIAVMGKSGSGKSTLLSMIGTLNKPSEGTLKVEGIDVYGRDGDGLADFRRDHVGFVFQNFNLVPYLTLCENVMLPLAIMPIPKAVKQRRADDALIKVGLRDKSKRLPGQISGGEQERVAIARAIVNRPRILLADEPTGNLDTRTGAEIMALMRALNSEGMTIIMVTHSPQYSRYASRVLHVVDGVLKNGQQQELQS